VTLQDYHMQKYGSRIMFNSSPHGPGKHYLIFNQKVIHILVVISWVYSNDSSIMDIKNNTICYPTANLIIYFQFSQLLLFSLWSCKL